MQTGCNIGRRPILQNRGIGSLKMQSRDLHTHAASYVLLMRPSLSIALLAFSDHPCRFIRNTSISIWHCNQARVAYPKRLSAHSKCLLPFPCRWSRSRLQNKPSRQIVSIKIMSSTSSQGLTALGSALLGLSTIAITLRFYARHTQKTPVKSDDWVMIPCLVSTQSLEAANRHQEVQHPIIN